MANEDLLLKIGADVKGARKDLERFTKTVKTQSSASERAFRGLKVAAGAAVAAFAGAKVIGAFKAAIDAAGVQEDAVNALNAALFRSGQFTQDASKGFQDFASSLQKTTRFGDEVILQNAALIQNLGNLSNNELKGATTAALDLASALKIDLKAASTLIGKAAAGNISSFSRYGVTIETGATKAETFANTLKAIQKQMGGAAQQDVQSFSGRMDQLNNAIGDTAEQLGFIVTENPAVIGAINILTEAFVGIGDIVAGNKDSITDLVTSFTLFSIQAVPLFLRGMDPLLRTFDALLKLISVVSIGIIDLVEVFLSFDFARRAIANFFDVFKLGAFAALKGMAKLADFIADNSILAQIFGVDETLRGGAGFFDEIAESLAQDIATPDIDVDAFREKLGPLKNALIETAGSFSDGLLGAAAGSSELAEKLQKMIDELGLKVKVEPADGADGGSPFGPPKAASSVTGVSAEMTKERAKGLKEAEKIFNDFEDKKASDEALAAKKLESTLGVAASLIEALGKGAEGAKDAVIEVSGMIADSFLPGLGGITKTLLGFAEDPEAFKGLIKAFVGALPEVIKTLGKGLGDILIILAEQSDEIFLAIIENLPEVIESLIRATPKIAVALVKAAPAILRGLGGLVADIVKLIGKLLGEGMGEVGIKLGDAIQGPVDDLINKLNGPADKFKGVFENIGRNFNAIALNFGRTIDNAFGGVFSKISQVFGTLFTNLGGVFETAFDSIVNNLGKGISDGATDFVDTLIGGIESFFSDGLGQFFEGFAESFTELFAKLDPTKAGKKNAENVENFFRDPIGTINGDRSFGLTGGGRSFGGASNVTPIGDSRSGQSDEAALLRAILNELKAGNNGTAFASDKVAKMLLGLSNQKARTA